MKNSIRKIILLIFFISGAVAQIKPVTTESIFQFDGNEYKIKVKVRDAANSSGHGQIISYSVYLNNKFIHPADWDGGSVTGCRYPFTELQDNFTVSTLESDSISIGWIISTGGICGNTKSSKLVFIIPPHKRWGNLIEYELLAKQEPLIRNNNGKIEIWYIYQEWGRGGTSTSIFVPQKIIIDPSKKYKYEIISKGNVLNGILEIDTSEWGYYKNHFLNLYVAGLNDLNIELMEYSLNNLYNSDETDWYNSFFGGDNQISKNYFTNIINDIKNVRGLNEKYKWYTKWELPSAKEESKK